MLVDGGIVTGATMPIAPSEIIAELESLSDEIVCLATPQLLTLSRAGSPDCRACAR